MLRTGSRGVSFQTREFSKREKNPDHLLHPERSVMKRQVCGRSEKRSKANSTEKLADTGQNPQHSQQLRQQRSHQKPGYPSLVGAQACPPLHGPGGTVNTHPICCSDDMPATASPTSRPQRRWEAGRPCGRCQSSAFLLTRAPARTGGHPCPLQATPTSHAPQRKPVPDPQPGVCLEANTYKSLPV